MYVRIWTIVIAVMLMATGLLAMRQQRINTANELVQLQRQIDSARQESWALQVQIGERLRPQWLQQAVEQTELALEPDLPATPWADGALDTQVAQDPAHGPEDADRRTVAMPMPAYLPH